MMKKIAKSQLSQLCQRLSEEYKLFLPIEKDGKVDFAMWHEGDKINIEALKTSVSPKGTIFPQSETYLKFEREGKKLHLENISGKKENYVVLGVKACDLSGIQLIDRVFLRDPVDRLYEDSRNKGTIISMACNTPEDTCFCSAFGIEPQEASPGADISTWDMGDKLLWYPQTEKGKALTEKLAELLEDIVEEDREKLKELQEGIKDQLNSLPLSYINPEGIAGQLKDLFESEAWEELSRTCLGCGSCTYVCPTCHCYDISDYNAGKSGERFRCWDSCMFSDFTLMAHGNIRNTQKERFRQRFMHKLVYYYNNHELYACVGCGRCIEQCPVHLDIVKVIKKLGGEK